MVNVAFVPEAKLNKARLETLRVVKVAEVPEAVLKVKLPEPVALVKYRLVIVELGVLSEEVEVKPAMVKAPELDNWNTELELIWKLRKSPLKTGLLKPIKVPEALPEIKVY